MLYCIPPDLFLASRTEHSIIHGCHGGCSCTGGSPSQRANSCDGELWREWWADDDAPVVDSTLPQHRGAYWPLRLRGTELGRLEARCAALAVNETPELTVWAVADNGKARVWVVGGIAGRRRRDWMTSLVVARDGSVVGGEDSEEWEEEDGDIYDEYSGAFEGFDGEHAPDVEVDEAFGYTLSSQPGDEKRYVVKADESSDEL